MLADVYSVVKTVNLECFLDRLYGGARNPLVDPAAIPCIETSDSVRLCRNPLVSVRLITYNHEPYIRKCLESVLGQKTDFEYEVVVGEDCSQDKTREICFEFQKRYPEKVRVLWSHENVYKLDGNLLRTAYRCRGEYVAYLEGDDYWTDDMKLQKQADLMRKANAVCCVANFHTLYSDGRTMRSGYRSKCGVFSHDDMFHFYPHTSTYLVRREACMAWRKVYPGIHGDYDVVMLHCLIGMGKVVMLEDVVSTYRLTGAGIATSLSGQEKQILAIKQYLDLYLHGPRSCHNRFGSQVMTYIAYFFNRSTPGWTKELTKEYANDFIGAFWTIYWRQPFDLRTLRAMARYLRFRLGFSK